MDKAEIMELWMVELHKLGGIRCVQVKDALEVNRMIAANREREVDRMAVGLCRTFEEARAAVLEVKRGRREL